ncbi:MAG TPA: transcription elongation factor GreB [Gammaproteobacteria bacterium]|nr:transcription elongation factor GreB [Gammaproteobacteria bacterium]
MSRYRPPGPPSSKYITAEGSARLREELELLWKIKRPAVTKAVAEAAAQGDRSENAEYIYGKKQLGEIDRRIRHLRRRLEGIRVVDEPPGDPGRVYFGAWFELDGEDGERRRYRLVGPDEVGFADDYVSIDSPLGRAVRGKALGDELSVAAPGGERLYRVARIEYAAASERAVEKKPGSRPGSNSQGESR